METYGVCFDLETRDKIQEMRGRFREDKVRQLSISCLCAIKFSSSLALSDPSEALKNAERLVYWAHREGDVETFLRVLDGALVVGGFNVLGFDYQVLSRYYQKPGGGGTRRYREHTYKTVDPFSRIRDATTVWYKLDALLKANRLQTKTANGLQAITWWNEQELDILQEYCMADVELCAELMLQEKVELPDGDLVPPHIYSFQSTIRLLLGSGYESSKRPRASRDENQSLHRL